MRLQASLNTHSRLLSKVITRRGGRRGILFSKPGRLEASNANKKPVRKETPLMVFPDRKLKMLSCRKQGIGKAKEKKGGIRAIMVPAE